MDKGYPGNEELMQRRVLGWDAHEKTADVLASARLLEESEMPAPTDAKPITVRVDTDTLVRYQTMAGQKRERCQT